MIPINNSIADTDRESIEFRLSEATKYSRAVNRMRGIYATILDEKKVDPDTSLEIVREEVRSSISRLESLADIAWKDVYAHAEPRRENLEALAQGVILCAVNDYEQALSAETPDGEQKMADIERFAEKNAGSYSSIDLPAVLSRIRAIYPQYKSFAAEHGQEIHEDSKRIKKAKDNYTDYAKYRCPLCGGGLYTANGKVNGKYKVYCSNCYLWAWTGVVNG